MPWISAQSFICNFRTSKLNVKAIEYRIQLSRIKFISVDMHFFLIYIFLVLDNILDILFACKWRHAVHINHNIFCKIDMVNTMMNIHFWWRKKDSSNKLSIQVLPRSQIKFIELRIEEKWRVGFKREMFNIDQNVILS